MENVNGRSEMVIFVRPQQMDMTEPQARQCNYKAGNAETRPTIVVPAGTWQAARPVGAYTLAGCTVGPGFEFADFSLAVDWPEIVAKIANAGPDLARFI